MFEGYNEYEKQGFFIEAKDEILYRYNNFVGSLRSVKTGIMNFWYFRKEIWNYRWWDYGFFMNTMKSRLQFMHDHWDESHYLKSEKEKAIIAEALEILDEIDSHNETWHEDQKELSYLYQKFGRLLFDVKEVTTTYEIDGEETVSKTVSSNIERLWD